MPATLDALLAKGYKFVTVSQLIAMNHPKAPLPSATVSRTSEKWGFRSNIRSGLVGKIGLSRMTLFPATCLSHSLWPRLPGMKTRDLATSAFRFVLIIGVANLFADMTDEGARSVTGPFLGSLGASATVVGFVAGFGELIGYSLRSVSGYLLAKLSSRDRASAEGWSTGL
jgi:hypothetical protein